MVPSPELPPLRRRISPLSPPARLHTTRLKSFRRGAERSTMDARICVLHNAARFLRFQQSCDRDNPTELLGRLRFEPVFTDTLFSPRKELFRDYADPFFFGLCLQKIPGLAVFGAFVIAEWNKSRITTWSECVRTRLYSDPDSFRGAAPGRERFPDSARPSYVPLVAARLGWS